MYKISIIIPVFNAGEFLKRTIEGIIGQTIGFENIELILIDDCSSDNSREIIEEYSEKYDNIKPIFLEKNSGLASYPRNQGIDKATAEYMMFLDSDDEIFDDYCEVLYNKITSYGVDIVNCNNSSKLNNIIYAPNSIKKVSTDDIVVDKKDKLFLKHTAWGNIYKSSLIKDNNIKFPMTMYEDGLFSIECLLNTDKDIIRLPDYPGYIYLIENEDSFTHKASLRTINGFLDGYKLCLDLLEKSDCDRDTKERLVSSFINMAIFILIKLDDLDKGIQMLHDFEKSLDYNITLPTKPLNMVNNKIINGQFGQAKLILKSMAVFYNNKKIRNRIFIKNGNLVPLETLK